MVHPTVGLPLLLGSVALTSLAVHTAVMTHTTWMGNYWSGSARVKMSDGAAIPDASSKPAAFSMTVTPAPATTVNGQQASFVITVAPVPTPAQPAGAVTTASADPAASDPGSGPAVGAPSQSARTN